MGNSASLTRGAGLSTVERVERKQRERHAGRGDFHGGNGRAENSASLTRGAGISTVETVERKQRERHAGRGVLRRLIRAFARTPALANAGAKLPWHREAARPKPALVLFGLPLCFGICVLAVPW